MAPTSIVRLVKSRLLPPSAALLALAVLAGCDRKPAVAPSVNPESARTFDATAAYLDAGGDYYLYLRTGQILDRVPAAMDEWKVALVEAAGKDLPMPPAEIDAYYALVKRTLLDSGITQIRALGLSGIELEPGLSRTRSIIFTGPLEKRGLLWRLGGKDAPHPFAALDFLPATTVYAGFSDFDPTALWAFVEQILAGIPDPALRTRAVSLPGIAEGVVGMKMPELFAAMGSEYGFVITADETRTMTVPASAGPLTLPLASAGLVLRVPDDKLYNLVTAKLDEFVGRMMPLKKSDAAGIRQVVVPIPASGWPIQPTIARFGNYLVIATGEELVQQLARTGGSPPPLMRDTAAFQKFTKLEKMEGNAFAYLTERGSAILRTVQIQPMKKDVPPALLPKIEKLYEAISQKFVFSIGRVERDGYATTGYTQNGSEQVVAAALVVPAAVIAAIAIPAVVQAREKAMEARARAEALRQAAPDPTPTPGAAPAPLE